MSKKVYKIKGMNCDACAKMIELDLEDIGISAKCDFASKTLVVETKENEEFEKKIKEVITKQGFKLTS